MRSGVDKVHVQVVCSWIEMKEYERLDLVIRVITRPVDDKTGSGKLYQWGIFKQPPRAVRMRDNIYPVDCLAVDGLLDLRGDGRQGYLRRSRDRGVVGLFLAAGEYSNHQGEKNEMFHKIGAGNTPIAF